MTKKANNKGKGQGNNTPALCVCSLLEAASTAAEKKNKNQPYTTVVAASAAS